MTGEFKECDKLCGVRLLDKSKTGAENSFRIEVWTKFSSDNDEAGKIMKQYIEEVFCALIRECKDSIVKVNTASVAVPVFVTKAFVPAVPVVVVPTASVVGPAGPCAPVAPWGPAGKTKFKV